MPNTVTIAAATANTTKTIEYSLDGGATWQDANVFSAVPAGTLAIGQVKARLKTSNPAVVTTWNAAVVVNYAQPAPTITSISDTTNRVFVDNRVGSAASNFRVVLPGSLVLQLPAGLRALNSTSFDFTVGDIVAAAGTVKVCEVDAGGLQISPFAVTAAAFTAGFTSFATALSGNSLDNDMGMVRANGTTGDNQSFDRLFQQVMALQTGKTHNYYVEAANGRSVTQQLLAGAQNNLNLVGTNILGNLPVQSLVSNDYINDYYQAGNTKEVTQANTVQFWTNNQATGLWPFRFQLGPTDIVQPATTASGGALQGTWSANKAWWNANMPAALGGLATYISFAACPYLGVVGAAARGLYLGIFRDEVHHALLGRKIYMARLLAVMYAELGLRVVNDLGTPAATVTAASLAIGTASIQAVEATVDGGTTWQVTDYHELSDTSAGSITYRLLADTSLSVTRPFVVATGFAEETLVALRLARIAMSYDLSATLANRAVAAAKATTRYSDFALLLTPGGGVNLLPSDGTSVDKVAVWRAVAGPNALPSIASGSGSPAYDVSNHRLDFNAGSGSNRGLTSTFSTPIVGNWTIVLDVDYTATAYESPLSFNGAALGIVAVGNSIHLTYAAVDSADVTIAAGRQAVVVKWNGTQLSIRVGSQEAAFAPAIASLDTIEVGGWAARSLGTDSPIYGCYVLKGTWSNAAIDAFAAAL